MKTTNVLFIFVCAVTAGALSWPLSATADATAPTSNGTPQVLGGRPLTVEEMSQVRGSLSRVTIRINGTVYEQVDPAHPGSASLKIPLGSNTYTGGSASTSGTSTTSTATSSVTMSGVTFKTKTGP